MSALNPRKTFNRRAIDAAGAVHAIGHTDEGHVTTACALRPAPAIECQTDDEYSPVTCPKCWTALAVVIPCPRCKTPGAERFSLPSPIPNISDSADCARCTTCGHSWGLDPGAHTACTECGGSGTIGGQASIRAPDCPCLKYSQLDSTNEACACD